MFFDWLTREERTTPLALQLIALAHSVPEVKNICTFQELERIYNDKLKKNADDPPPLPELWRTWLRYCKANNLPL